MLKPKHLVIVGGAGYAAVTIGMVLAGQWPEAAILVGFPSAVVLFIGLMNGGGDRWM